MSKKWFKTAMDFASPSNYLMNELGVSESNTLRQVLNPGGLSTQKLGEAYEEGGTKGALSALKEGDITDPGGWFHNVGGVAVTDPGAAPTEDASAAGNLARDRIRRKVYAAQGRSSTIKVSPQAEPYNATGKKLLGQ